LESRKGKLLAKGNFQRLDRKKREGGTSKRAPAGKGRKLVAGTKRKRGMIGSGVREFGSAKVGTPSWRWLEQSRLSDALRENAKRKKNEQA